MKKAVVTGGSQGLGKGIARQLLKNGYKVIIVARREKLLRKAVDELGNMCKFEVCDIRDEVQVGKFAEKVKDKFGKLDLLVNNAGVWTDDSLELSDSAKRKAALETNVLGQIQVTESLLPLLKGKKVSRILNVLSTSGVLGIPAGDNRLWKSYGASKWGFNGYCYSLREDLRETNVQVLQFYPGGFDSNLYENAGRDNPHNQPWMMKVEDVADVAMFAVIRPDDVYMEQVVASKFM